MFITVHDDVTSVTILCPFISFQYLSFHTFKYDLTKLYVSIYYQLFPLPWLWLLPQERGIFYLTTAFLLHSTVLLPCLQNCVMEIFVQKLHMDR